MAYNIIKKVGFIGLGKMGTPIAKNILKAGYELTVYNRTADKLKPLLAEGATVSRLASGSGYRCRCCHNLLDGRSN